MKRILVVCPAGADEPWVAGSAAQLARETEAEVVVLGVDDVESQRFETLPREELAEQARKAAERLADLLAEEGVNARVEMRSGPAADSAIALATELDCDLIVVGSGNRGRVLGRVLGNLSMELVQRAGRQVLVVSEPA